MLRGSWRMLARLFRAAPLVLVSCAGESVRNLPTCQTAWQELVIPAELRPFYPEGGAWESGHLAVLSFSAQSPYKSQERGLVYDPLNGFSVMSEEGMPNIGALAPAVAWGDGVAFISVVDANGVYDVSSRQWVEVPAPGLSAYVQTTAGARADLAISYDRVTPPDGGAVGSVEARVATYALGDRTWRDASELPFTDWHGPALAWTGSELLAWGGTNGEHEEVSAAARYDPGLDAWLPVSMDGAPSAPGGGIAWTDPEAVAWGSQRYEVASTGGRYDPATDRWRPVAAPPTGAGFGAPAFAVEGKVVSWTGSLQGSTSRVAVYDARSDSWVDSPMRCGPLPRRDPVFAWVGEGVVVWGGSIWSGDCGPAKDPTTCYDNELQRAFYLPRAALFGEVQDTNECACPAPK